jgi:parvulin-like peptidyl-prolyl isomerase
LLSSEEYTMKRQLLSVTIIPAVVLFGSLTASAAQSRTNLFDRPSGKTAPLFADTVVARGKGFEVKQSQVDEMYMAFKGHRAAMGVEIPTDLRPKIEADIIEKLVATKLFLLRATEQDKIRAKDVAEAFIADQKKQAPNEQSFRRQLAAVGMTPEEFEAQIREQAIVKVVIDREIKAYKKVSDADAKKFYEQNPTLFLEPEQVRASHILISTQDPITGKELTPELKLERKKQAEKILARAKAGEDFAKLVKEFSEDRASKDRGGEYTFTRSKDDPRRAMAPEFEAAAFSMQPNQISDIVETSYGYHIIKTLEKIPGKKTSYTSVENRIKDTLLRDEVEKALPEFVEKLKKEAGVEILLTQNTKK